VIKRKRSITRETAAVVTPNDLASALLGDVFDRNARIEIHVRDIRGNQARVDLVELMVVQFVREEVPEEPAEPPAAMDPA
jgi:hypothetical protein